MREKRTQPALAVILGLAAGMPALGPAFGAESELRANKLPIPVERPDRDAASRDAAAQREFIGAKVVSSDNRVSGQIEDIVVENGAPTAVIGYGGLLGLGDARVSMPLSEMRMVASGIARVRISDAQVRHLPRYEG